jgi:hypothetical protein
MYKKTLYSWIILTTFCVCFQVFWDESGEESCEYQWRLDQCIVANKNGSARSITEFSCLQSNNAEAILDQIILDVKFREVDDEVEAFLDALDQDKEPAATDTNRVIDDITKNLLAEWVFYDDYKKLCNGWILAERAKCNAVPITTAWERVKDSDLKSECMALVNNKLDIYAQVAYDITKLNKAQVLQDQYKKDIVQVMRGKFDELLSLMTDIVWFMWRLARWVTHWTGNPK